MDENTKVWNIFIIIRNNFLFRHYPFLLKSYLEGLQFHFSESELRRLGCIYSLYVNETARKYHNPFFPALFNL